MDVNTERVHPSRSLLVIDDSKIKRTTFKAVERMLKRIDRLEGNLASFHVQDQTLFNSWYQQTFKSERGFIAGMQSEFNEIAEFHNSVLLTSEMLGISLAEAYHLMKEEQELFASGREDARRRVFEARQARAEFARRQDEAEFHREERDSEFEEPEEEIEEEPGSQEEWRQDVISRLRAMDDDAVDIVCSNRTRAFELLNLTLNVCQTPDELQLFVRVWDRVPPKWQSDYKKKFKKRTGYRLDDLIEKIRRGDTEPQSSSSGTKSGSMASQIERFKLIYRKLVRRLHPDLQETAPGRRESMWNNRLWARAQQAHSRQDLREMEKLYKLTLLRQKAFSELTVGEMRESQNWLEEELSILQDEASGLKRLPAWGFTRRRNMDVLKGRMLKDLTREIEYLGSQIEGLRRFHAMLARDTRGRGRRRSSLADL